MKYERARENVQVGHDVLPEPLRDELLLWPKITVYLSVGVEASNVGC
jgi:hypothetical protein